MHDLEREVAAYLTERGWTDMTPADIAKSISIEAAELLELFQWDNQNIADTKADDLRMQKIRHELADVFINNPGAEPQGMAGALRAQPFPENRGFSDFPTRSPAAEPRGKGFANLLPRHGGTP